MRRARRSVALLTVMLISTQATLSPYVAPQAHTQVFPQADTQADTHTETKAEPQAELHVEPHVEPHVAPQAAPHAAQAEPQVEAQAYVPAHALAGGFRTHAQFHSEFLPTDRDVLVYLPPGYEAEVQRRYPVLYMHDGQNLFDGATSFIPGQDWRVDETAQALILARSIEPVIIVGIYNTGQERVEEYTPSADQRLKVGGKADLYGRLLVEELKPFIDSHYRTKTGASDTGLGGSSLGGLVTMYLGLRYPQVFGKLAVVSPSVWWDGRRILGDVAALASKPHTRIWLDMGTDEGAGGLADARLLRDALVSKGWHLEGDLRYFEAEGARHSEADWALRVEPILRFLFPTE